MSPEEFVCWMDGFRKGIIGLPNKQGWDRINEALENACRHLHASRKRVITVLGDGK